MRGILAVAAALNLVCIALELFYGRKILRRTYREGHKDGYSEGYKMGRRIADNWWTEIEQQVGMEREKIWRAEE